MKLIVLIFLPITWLELSIDWPKNDVINFTLLFNVPMGIES
tara:strand:+ start:639 stop:761 length:123 start_codon:yes stop_codon:yes gene_type:complete